MIPIIMAVARGLSAGLAKKTAKNLAKKTVKNQAKKEIKNTQNVKGSDLRPENRQQESGQAQEEQLKIVKKSLATQEKNDKKLSQQEKISQQKLDTRIRKTEEEISQIEKSLANKDDKDAKADPELIKIEKEKLEVLKDQLAIQKEQLEEQKEAEYEREHERKTSLKDKAKAMAVKVKDGLKTGMGKVANGIKNNKGLLAKLLGGAALIAAFWPMIKEKISSFVEWIADNIPDLLKSAWESVKEMATGIMDMIVKNGPGLIKDIINGVAKVASSLLDGIIKYGPTVLTMLINGVTTLAEKILKGIVEYGPKVLTMLINGVKTLAEKVLSLIVEYGPQVASMLWEGFKGLLKAVVPLLIEYVPKIVELIWQGLTVVFNDTVEGIKEYGPQVWEMVKSGITSAVGWVVGVVSEYGPQVWEMFKSGLGKAVDWVVVQASNFGNYIWIKIKDSFSNLVDLIKEKISNMGVAISDYIYEATGGMLGSKKMDENTANELIKASTGDKEHFLESVEKYGIIDESDIMGLKSTIKDKKKLMTLPPEVVKALKDSGDFSAEDEKLFQDILDGKVGPVNQTSNNPVAEMVEVQKNQFAKGGYTGEGDSKEIAGVVHYNEFVLSEEMLNEIESAKTQGEKDALIEKAAEGKGKNAIEAIREVIKRGEPSGYQVTINGVSVMLTNAQKEEYDKLAKETEDKLELKDKEEKFINNVAKGNFVDKDKNKVRYASEPSAPANQTNISKPAVSPSITKDDGSTFSPEPVKVKPIIPSTPGSSNTPKSVKDIKENDIFTGVKIKNMNKDVEHNLKAMGYEYKEKFGKKMQLNSTGRSITEQQKLYDRMLKRNNGRSDGSVATPGGSMHNYGLAVDAQTGQLNLAESSGLMAKYGFHRNVKKKDGSLETWHMEPNSLSDKDRLEVRANGRKAIKDGLDVDKMAVNGEFIKDKVTPILAGEDETSNSDAFYTKPANQTEGPIAGKDVTDTFIPKKVDKPLTEKATDDTSIPKKDDKPLKEKAMDTIDKLDKSSMAAAQLALRTVGLIDENGDLFMKTDSEKGISTSAVLGNQASGGDMTSMITPKLADGASKAGDIAKTGINKVKSFFNKNKKETGSETSKANNELTKMVKDNEESKLFGVAAKRAEDYKNRFNILDEREKQYKEISSNLEGKMDDNSLEKKKNVDKQLIKIANLKKKLANGEETTKEDDKLAEELKKDIDGNGEVSGKETVKGIVQEADELSLLGTQKALAAIGLIDENGDLAIKTDSEKGISTSSILGNQVSMSDMVSSSMGGISNIVGKGDNLLEKGTSAIGLKTGGLENFVRNKIDTGTNATKNFFGIGNGDSKTGLQMGKDLFSKAKTELSPFFSASKEEKTSASIGVNKAMEIPQLEAQAEIKKFQNKAEGLNKPSMENVEVSKSRPVDTDIGGATKRLAEKTAEKKVEQQQPVVNNNTTVVQAPPAAPTQINIDNSNFNDNTLALVGGII